MVKMYLTPEALSRLGAATVLVYFAVHLLTLRGGRRATRLLGLVAAAGAANSLGHAVARSAWGSTWHLSVAATATLFMFLLMLFAYRLAADDTPRERRVATAVGLSLCALGVVLQGVYYGLDIPAYQPVLLRETYLIRAWTAPLEGVLRAVSTTILVLGYAWTCGVMLRKWLRFERAAGASLGAALLRPRSEGGQTLRKFTLLCLALVLLNLSPLPGLDEVLVLIATSAVVLVHVDHSPEPTRLRFKLVAIPLAGIVGALILSLSAIGAAVEERQAAARRAELERVRGLLAAGARPRAEILDEDVAFVLRRPDADLWPTAADTLFVRPGHDLAVLGESLRRERALRVSATSTRAASTLAPEEAERLAEQRVREELGPYYATDTASFYGALLEGPARYRVERMRSGAGWLEVGFLERTLRQRLHGEILPLALTMLLVIGFVIAGLPFLLRASVLTPVRALMEGVERVAEGDLQVTVATRTRDELGRLAGSFNNMVGSLRTARASLQASREAAFRFVPQPFLRQLGHTSIVGVELGEQRARTMCVLFADVRGFTTLSEGLTPAQTFAFVNDLLSAIGPVIREHGGFIDKYLGDAVMALFPGSADRAVAAAIGMQRALGAFNAGRRGPDVRLGIGLHRGDLVLGIIGERERIEATVIADAVNAAARLEGLSKRYGAGVLISAAVREACAEPEAFAHRFVERVQVKGRAGALDVYEVFEAEPAPRREAKRASAAAFAHGLEALIAGDFDRAARDFSQVLAADPDDVVAALHRSRARRLAAAPPTDWDGVFRMTVK